MKTILICYPPFEGKNYLVSRSPFPIGPLYIAAYLKSKGIKAEVIDFSYPPKKRRTKRPEQLKTGQSNYFRFGWTDLQIKKFFINNAGKYHNIIGVSSLMSSNWSGAYRLIDIIKSVNAGQYQIVIGGPHATAFPDHVSKYSKADYICIGEGEEAFYDFVSGRKHEAVIESGWSQICRTTFIKNMNSLSFPKRSLLLDDRKTRSLYITFSRGCPHKCSFCGSHLIQGRKWRHKTVEFAIKEIKFYYEKWGVRNFIVEDDNPCPGKKGIKHLKDICKTIIKDFKSIRFEVSHGLPIYATADKELCELLYEAGFRHMTFPLESSNKEVLTDMKKTNVLNIWKDSIKNWNYEKNQPVQIILGYPFVETINTMLKTMMEISSVKCRIWASHFRLNKGTELFDRCLKAGYIGKNYDPINTQAFFLQTERFNLKDLQELMQISRGINYATEHCCNPIKEILNSKSFYDFKLPKKSGDIVANGKFKFKRSQNILAGILIARMSKKSGRPMCSFNKEGNQIIYMSHKPSRVYDTFYELITGKQIKTIRSYLK